MKRTRATRSSAAWLFAALVAVPAVAPATDIEPLRAQLEAQNDLLAAQSRMLEAQRGLLEQQARQIEQMGDRLRALEEARPSSSEAAPVSAAPVAESPKPHVPGAGFAVGESNWGSLAIRLHTYARYLNQGGLEAEYTDSFGRTRKVDDRHDVQLNKATVYFNGWALDRRLRYLLYVWSANTSQGLGAQVVGAGNLQFQFNEHLTLGAGINALPGTRSTSGNFPFWLGVDNRLIADEFFRPSYTSGIFATGNVVQGVDYAVMLGDNLSQLGVDAGRLDGELNTVSAAVSWQPLGDFGKGFGDFERHEELVTRLGIRFSYSDEDVQSQPDNDGFENVQIRLSDGTVIFEPDLFGPDVQIRNASYHMLAVDSGVKYDGYSLEGEYFYRLLNDFGGRGVTQLGFDDLEDHGFQLQASAMLLPSSLQLYVSGSRVFGDYGDPWDARVGFNWYPFESESLRWNNELIYVDDSPVGALSLPYLVGAEGPIFYSNVEFFF